MKKYSKIVTSICCIIAILVASVSTASASVTEGGFEIDRITKRTVSGDFNGDGIDDVAGIYYYGNGETRIFTWLSNGKDFSLNWNWWYMKSGFSTDRMTGRVVAGDFNGDGLTDICGFYDYGKGECRAFVWESTGSSFKLNWNYWYMNKGFTASNITDRVVAGDFNGDKKDDICAFYDYGKGECRAFVWESKGDSFKLNWNYWYMNKGFTASNITNRVVAGDFNGDKKDDVCAFYDYGKGECRAFVWESQTNSFKLNWNYWYMPKGFTASNINNRIVVGKFSDDDREDICAFYDYGKGECRAFVYNNMNGKFSLSWNYWYMKSGFTASNINNRVVAGDFNNDNRTDICAFYDYGKGLARAFVWHSWGGNMTLNWDYWYNEKEKPKPQPTTTNKRYEPITQKMLDEVQAECVQFIKDNKDTLFPNVEYIEPCYGYDSAISILKDGSQLEWVTKEWLIKQMKEELIGCYNARPDSISMIYPMFEDMGDYWEMYGGYSIRVLP